MSDRQMIADLLSALEYHAEQTRPIHSTTTAIHAAREHLSGAAPVPVAQGEPSDGWVSAYTALQQDRDALAERVSYLETAAADGGAWIWQGDGEDHPESMANSLPVVIRAEQLRELSAAPAPVAHPDIWQQHAAREKAEFWATDAAAPAPVAQPADLRERLEAAHEASIDGDDRACQAILRTLIQGLTAAPAPVAWLRAIDEAMVCHHVGVADASDDSATAKDKLNRLLCVVQDIGALHAAPVALTGAQKTSMWAEALHRPKDGPMTSDCWYLAGVEDAERAHGIAIEATGQEGSKDHG